MNRIWVYWICNSPYFVLNLHAFSCLRFYFITGVLENLYFTETKVQTEHTVGEQGRQRLKYTQGQMRKQITGGNTAEHDLANETGGNNTEIHWTWNTRLSKLNKKHRGADLRLTGKTPHQG